MTIQARMFCDGCRNPLVETSSGLSCPKCGIKIINKNTINLWKRLKQNKTLYADPVYLKIDTITPQIITD